MKKLYSIFIILIVFSFCTSKGDKTKVKTAKKIVKPVYKFGYKIKDYKVILDTIKSGESFGEIMDRHHVAYPKINQIASTIKDTFDVRRVRAGKPYVILASKDSLEQAKVFIYKNNKINATVVDFKDSIINAYTYLQPTKKVERIVAGKIYSNLSNTMDSLGLSAKLTWAVADIYAWTLDFYKLQKGDSFKLVFEEKFVNDSVFAGYENVKSAIFKHNNQEFYAFRFVSDSTTNIAEYYDENGNMLRSQFLKSPIKFQYRISSRYNLNRRIAYYGYKRKPHFGTDFAANIGTPIIATASGVVSESTRRGGNGNFVKIKHNGTYSTQYLHMKKRKVKKGEYVKQGQVIGTVGMTGNTGGPHVCYRFWKNGRQVDPLSPKTKLPEAEPLKKSIIPQFLEYIAPLKYQLDYNQLPAAKKPNQISEEIAKN